MQDIRPLQTAGGPFEPDSLFVKSVRHALTEWQVPSFEAAAKERRAFRHRAQVELSVDMLEQTMPMRDAQRQALVELLMQNTKPTHFGGYYDFYLVMEQLGRIPEEKVKPLFSPLQWKVLERQIAQYKGIVPNLRQNGYLIEEDDDAEATAPKK